MEAVVPEYDGAGVIREPSGSTVTGIVPTNTYRCRDGRYIVVGGNGDSIFRRLMEAVGRPEMAADPELAGNEGRVRHERRIDEALSAWAAGIDSGAALELLDRARVPAGPIYSVADMLADPHYRASELFETVEVDGAPLRIPAIVPRLDDTPGATRWPGPDLGSHNDEVFGNLLALDATRRRALREAGVI